MSDAYLRKQFRKSVKGNARKLKKGTRNKINQALKSAALGGNTDIFEPRERNRLARAMTFI